ncbi:MAG: L-threonylcarbamoyladenylate synthase [Aeromicrobium sp.]|uniref:L-threonylcarbamoyladenylate synthase n=1 Tax=Aeromicrobium sp. TaxID=1871063 RepID=UPI0039E5A371
MSTVYDGREPGAGRDEGVEAALAALRGGALAVLPTDTVYGLAADAFNPAAVQRLLDAKGRDRTMPPPVLVAEPATLAALAAQVPAWLRDMTAELWPGPLTVICRQQPSLNWDLGETRQTVAVRVPDDDIARAVLRKTGPLAVSSANRTGGPAATTVDEAREQLGESVEVYLDGGPSRSGVPSTILDLASATPRILRAGAVRLDELHRFNNTVEDATRA